MGHNMSSPSGLVGDPALKQIADSTYKIEPATMTPCVNVGRHSPNAPLYGSFGEQSLHVEPRT